ncbi:pilus assembly protein [Arcanobacterium phocisimile]|uniref:Pilus assembly protein n=1 Tax=Arcanobacterium phocisimile TaxID=1302235 RepID=A0ABX7IEW4_9ACTO|nr:pilus assembly protein [Arcanobacterium phocisimile]QRV01684.1 pilus assembly protein [Arcanobacterium phocisimile]
MSKPRLERGNAVVGFTATVGLLLIVTVTVMSIGLTWFAREVMNDSVALGARIAGLSGSNESIARQRTQELITQTLPQDFAHDVEVSYGTTWVEVSASAPAPVLGLLLPVTIEVSARAPIE